MGLKNNYLILIFSVIFLFSCNSLNEKSQTAYQTKFINGSTGNKLEILDFGGSGQAILFLTGLGNTAHVFVDFAPKFTNKFHVYAMSRRGYGASEQTANGYGVDTLAKDILAVTNALHIDKVILIGHSIAGEEISKFASSYPDRVEKVIYLDAAYDRTNIMTALMPYMPAYPNPTTKDFSSFINWKSFVVKRMGISMPDEEFKAGSVFSKDGRYLKDVTPDSIRTLIIIGIEHPDYKNIDCPALAIYSIHNSINQIFPFYASLDVENKKRADTFFTLENKWAKEQIETFKKEVKKGTVKEIEGANHYVFISNPEETEKLIREFLK